VRSGAYQDAFEAWFNFHFGLRPGAVRLDSYLTYRLFGHTPAISRVVAGSNGALFSDEDVAFFNLAAPIPVDAYRSRLELLARLQVRLAAAGKALVPVIIPSKTSFNAEDLPPRLRARVSDAVRPSDASYLALRAALESAGVRFVDARRSLASMSGHGVRPFPLKGRHLSRVAACQVAWEILQEGRALLGEPLGPRPCEPLVPVAAGYWDDEWDLWRLLNVWKHRGERYDGVLREATPPLAEPAVRAPVLLVGSSFNWNVRDAMTRASATGGIHVWYYNVTAYDRHGGERKLRPYDADWRDVVEESEIIAFDIPEMFLPGFGYGFLEQLAEAEGLQVVARADGN
jgi:hypothetical protein